MTKGRRTCRRSVAGSSLKERRFVAETTWTLGPKRAKLAVPKGKRPKGPDPRGRPRGHPKAAPPNDRDQPPPPRSQRGLAKTGDSAPVRPLERSLWVPPTTDPFRLAPSGKPRKGKARKEEPPMPRPPPLCPLELRLMMAGRAPSRNAPSVAESPQNLTAGGTGP